jgi:hypothetical protein
MRLLNRRTFVLLPPVHSTVISAKFTASSPYLYKFCTLSASLAILGLGTVAVAVRDLGIKKYLPIISLQSHSFSKNHSRSITLCLGGFATLCLKKIP